MAKHKSQIFAGSNADENFWIGKTNMMKKNPTKLSHFLLVEFNPKTTSIKSIAGDSNKASLFYNEVVEIGM